MGEDATEHQSETRKCGKLVKIDKEKAVTENMKI